MVASLPTLSKTLNFFSFFLTLQLVEGWQSTLTFDWLGVLSSKRLMKQKIFCTAKSLEFDFSGVFTVKRMPVVRRGLMTHKVVGSQYVSQLGLVGLYSSLLVVNRKLWLPKVVDQLLKSQL